MRSNSLASSRKAWKAIQGMIGRVLYGAQYNQVGQDDRIRLQTLAATDHPFKVTRSGNTIRFSPGLVENPYGPISTTKGWLVTDGGGYEYEPGTPVYLYVTAIGSGGVPFQITNSIYTYVAIPVEPYVSQVASDGFGNQYQAATSLAADVTDITFVPPDAAGGLSKIPICYITDTTTIQLLTGNISIVQIAAHRNLYLWP